MSHVEFQLPARPPHFLRRGEVLAGAAPENLRELLRFFARVRAGNRDVADVFDDEQIARLYDLMRSFATSDDDMAFTETALRAVTARTLIVHGEQDPYYPTEMALELARGIPNSTLWIVPGGPHGPVFGTLAEPFASRALAHLSTCG